MTAFHPEVLIVEAGVRFNALMGLLAEPEGLRESFESQPGNKAPGVDGIRKQAYAQGGEDRLATLSAAVRRLGYPPKPVRRVYIPKSNGGRRPLGVPSFEDRMVQDRLSRILQAIWEAEFRDCSKEQVSGLLLSYDNKRPDRSQ